MYRKEKEGVLMLVQENDDNINAHKRTYGPYVQNTIIRSFLKRRGLSSADIDYLVHPNVTHQHDPFLLRGVESWIQLLHSVKGKKLAIIPDYDADGVLSGTVARVGLSLFGFGDAFVYPPRTFDGYGLSKRSIDGVLKAQPDTDVIITTDNGSNAHEGILYAKSKGLIVLVTDHHLADADPPADAVVNPNRKHRDGVESYPFTQISGTTVIYKTLLAYARKYVQDEQALRDFHALVLLVGISTISDVMPVLNENRYYVTRAVTMLNTFIKGHSAARIYAYDDTPIGQYYRGVDLLTATLQANGKLRYGVTPDTFGFVIGPMLNSPRRMTGESKMAFDLFQTKRDALFNAAGETPSDVLFKLNETRKAYVRSLTSGLFRRIKKSEKEGVAPIHYAVFNAVSKAGIAGLLAGAFTQKYGLPSVAFSVPGAETPDGAECAEDFINVDPSSVKTLSGSARAPESFDLHRFLSDIDKAHPGLIIKWGGHAQAAGITIPAEQFDAFRSIFVGKLMQVLSECIGVKADNCLPITSEYVLVTHTYKALCDAYGAPSMCDEIEIGEDRSVMAHRDLLQSVQFFEQLAPFGNGFPKPSFGFAFSMKDARLFLMGQEKQHVKLVFPNGLSVIYWNGRDVFSCEALAQDERTFIVTGSLHVNEYGGNATLQLIAEDVLEVSGG